MNYGVWSSTHTGHREVLFEILCECVCVLHLLRSPLLLSHVLLLIFLSPCLTATRSSPFHEYTHALSLRPYDLHKRWRGHFSGGARGRGRAGTAAGGGPVEATGTGLRGEHDSHALHACTNGCRSAEAPPGVQLVSAVQHLEVRQTNSFRFVPARSCFINCSFTCAEYPAALSLALGWLRKSEL